MREILDGVLDICKSVLSWLKRLADKLLGLLVPLLIGTVVVVVVGSIPFYLFCVSFVDNYQMGYKFNAWTGQLTILERSGYFINYPFVVKVHTVDLRPMQVSISANQRVLNAKLVQFKKDEEGLKLFLSWHGRKDYEGGHEEVGSFQDIMKSYAYDESGNNYPFLTVLRDLKNERQDFKSLPHSTKTTEVGK